MNLSIKRKILIITLLPLLMVTIILSAQNMASRISELHRVMEERGNMAVKQLAFSSEYGVVTGNRLYLSQVIGPILNEPDVVSVIIADNHNEILASGTSRAFNHLAPDKTDDTGLLSFSSPIHNIDFIQEDAIPDAFTAEVPAPAGDEVLGTVTLTITRDNIIERQYSIIYDGVILASFVIIAAILLALVTSRTVTGPISLIISAVKEIKKGDLSQRISLDQRDELQDLAEGINEMSAALHSHIQLEKRHSENNLLLEKIRAHTALDSISEAAISIDADGRIVHMNNTAEHYTGWSKHEARGKSLSEILMLVDEKDGSTTGYSIQENLDQKENEDNVICKKMIDRDNNIVPIYDTSTVIEDDAGNSLGAVIVFHNSSAS
jgi:PAS domain S-box-containing protein